MAKPARNVTFVNNLQYNRTFQVLRSHESSVVSMKLQGAVQTCSSKRSKIISCYSHLVQLGTSFQKMIFYYFLSIFRTINPTYVRRPIDEDFPAEHGRNSIMIWGCMVAQGTEKCALAKAKWVVSNIHLHYKLYSLWHQFSWGLISTRQITSLP